MDLYSVLSADFATFQEELEATAPKSDAWVISGEGDTAVLKGKLSQASFEISKDADSQDVRMDIVGSDIPSSVHAIVLNTVFDDAMSAVAAAVQINGVYSEALSSVNDILRNA